MKRTTNSRKKKRIGRGGARGGKSGRGDKGQRSRAGRNIRPALRDELQRVPKRRGHNKNRARGVRTGGKEIRNVTVRMLEKNFAEQETVTPSALVRKNIINNIRGRTPAVKIIATGTIEKPITVRRCAVSGGARKIIETAGGTIR